MKLIYYIIYEIIELLLYIIFFILVYFYLYYSNDIIIKHIIFLFLDFSEQKYDIERRNYNNKLMSLKLAQYKRLIKMGRIKEKWDC